MGSSNRARLQALIDDAIVDCYNDDEQLTGLYTMLDEHLELPFETTVLGVTVTVDAIDLRESGDLVAVCSRDGTPAADPARGPPFADTTAAGRRVGRGLPALGTTERSARMSER